MDNAMMLAIPGAMEAGLGDTRFWISLAVALVPEPPGPTTSPRASP